MRTVKTTTCPNGHQVGTLWASTPLPSKCPCCGTTLVWGKKKRADS